MPALPPITVRHHGSASAQAKPLALVLHGGPGAPGSVRSLAVALADDFRLWEPIQRGSGFDGERPLTVVQHVNDLAEVAPQRARLVGWSWGAMLALSFAAVHPDRVASIALVGCGTYTEQTRTMFREATDAALGEGGLAAKAAWKAVENEPESEAKAAALSRYIALIAATQHVDPISDADGNNDDLPVDMRANRETWDDVLRLQADGVEPARFAAISAPVLMLHGAQDPHPGAATADVLRASIPHLDYRQFDRCGHTPWLECHGRKPFLTALRAWLAAH